MTRLDTSGGARKKSKVIGAVDKFVKAVFPKTEAKRRAFQQKKRKAKARSAATKERFGV